MFWELRLDLVVVVFAFVEYGRKRTLILPPEGI